MKGIIVTPEEFKKIPNYLRSRVIITFSGKDKFHIISLDDDKTVIGEIVCSITGENKLPVFDCKTRTINWIYPKWNGERIGDE